MSETHEIVGGVDTHRDTIHVAAIATTGQSIGDREFPTNPAGYRAAGAYLDNLGTVRVVGIEGTASYGAGITRALAATGIAVVEVTRASKSARRLKGKSDPLDAYSAARTALAGEAIAIPKDEQTTALRALLIARRSGMKTRTAAINQIKALLVGAPDAVREKYRDGGNSAVFEALTRCRPDSLADPIAAAVLTACKALAERIRFLEQQDQELTKRLDALSNAVNPALRAAYGVGPDTAAQLIVTAGTNAHRLRSESAFAALCGVAPVLASSGKTNRHRLSRGGDRAANNALFRIALVRMASHQPTKEYTQRQLANGRSKRDILRLLKRAIAREVFKLLTQQVEIPSYADLRPARQAKNITVTAAANHFGVWPNIISRIERGLQRDDPLADRYRNWLLTA